MARRRDSKLVGPFGYLLYLRKVLKVIELTVLNWKKNELNGFEQSLFKLIDCFSV